jgi:hypothetical protein
MAAIRETSPVPHDPLPVLPPSELSSKTSFMQAVRTLESLERRGDPPKRTETRLIGTADRPGYVRDLSFRRQMRKLEKEERMDQEPPVSSKAREVRGDDGSTHEVPEEIALYHWNDRVIQIPEL